MHGTIMPKQKEPHWAACQIFSNQVHAVRADIEREEHGTFLPTFVQIKYVGGKKYAQEVPLFPGYLLFKTEPDKWGAIPEIEGVIDVLAHSNIASRITDEEMYRLTVESAMGTHNKIESAYGQRKRNSRRRRRPRPGKALRANHERG